ncbi:synemin-like [Acipenser oxyrinchus oxyrinchus]|uniref:Synemin-like n=1 Tax=Acipenser oxyrinchus oxyrinchus TaxID=40147 RepID=A0AAD8CUT3_ACIOX|nr:synemin-like [Acipenser oxyrinchus oxyrinchus]
MLHFSRTFENEKLQLQELNKRLSQYLSRVKQLEQENATLLIEISTLRQERMGEWEQQQQMVEMRGLRRAVDQLALEKAQAEMERERLRRELQLVQELICQESGTCRDIHGELKGCDKHLQQACLKNLALEEHLLRLQWEQQALEDSHRQEICALREQLCSKLVPMVTQQGQSPPALTLEEVEEYTLSLSQAWAHTVELHHTRVEELEESLWLDQQRLEELCREKRQSAAQLEKLREEMHRQSHIQEGLESELVNLQENCDLELQEYQVLIEQLEEERRELSIAITEKLKDHQELMQVKIGLSMEVATYRALLEEEKTETYLWTGQHVRQAPRNIGIGKPSHMFTVKREDGRKQFPFSSHTGIRYEERASSASTVSRPGQVRTYEASRTVPSGFSERVLLGGTQVPYAARKDVSSSARTIQVSSSSSRAVPQQAERKSVAIKPRVLVETTVSSTEVTTHPARDAAIILQRSSNENRAGLPTSPTAYQKPTPEDITNKRVIVTSPIKAPQDPESADESKVKITEVTIGRKESTEEESVDLNGFRVNREQVPENKKVETTLQGLQIQNGAGAQKQGLGEDQPEGQTAAKYFSEQQIQIEKKYKKQVAGASPEDAKRSITEEKVLDTITMEDILQQVVNPSGLETTLSSSPDSKVTYHIEKTQVEDGTTKTQIFLQSTVREDLDISDDSVLEELLNKGEKRTALEDIRGTPTGSMIENLLSLGMTGWENLENMAVNVEIIEEPLETQSDEENEEKLSSTFFQIEELENAPVAVKGSVGSEEALSVTMTAEELGKRQFSDTDPSFQTRVQENEYFVSTPDDYMPEHQESDLSSFDLYGVRQEWSGDERCWQEEPGPNQEQSFTDTLTKQYWREPQASEPRAEFDRAEFDRAEFDRAEFDRAEFDRAEFDRAEFDRAEFDEQSSSECVVEEEIKVPRKVQESVLELLREDGHNPKQQLKGALEQLKGTVSDNLREELAVLTSNGQDSSDSLAVDIRKVQQSSDSGVVTIVAEINVSQNLDESGLPVGQGGFSDEQVMAALRSTNPQLHEARSGKAGEKMVLSHSADDKEPKIRVSTDQDVRVQGMSWTMSSEDPGSPNAEQSAPDINKSVKHIKLGPSEKSFTFQMDVSQVASSTTGRGPQEAKAFNSQAEFTDGANVRAVREEVYQYVQRAGEEGEEQVEMWDPSQGETAAQFAFSKALQQQRIVDPRSVISEEQRIAALYLDEDDKD